MKKFSEKIKNNKGFSLVELIVVVAIMAVLMAVLVPTLVRNVEKTRVQKDKNAIAEVRQAVITAMAQEQFQDAAASTAGATVTSGKFNLADLFDSADGSKGKALAAEVEATIGAKTVALSSSMKESCKVKIVELDSRKGKCTIQVDSDGTDNDFYIDVEGEHSGLFGASPSTK